MMGKSMEQIELLADRVFMAVKAHIATSVGAIAKRLDDFEQRLREIPAGKDGAPGKTGATGERGEAGAQGPIGAIGDPGAPGEKGERGETGERGPPGEKGDAGDRGEVGEKGEPGERGTDGLTAKDGAPGERGERGEKGEAGLDGLPGKNGQDGQQGQDGEKGAPGRDALQIDILPAIDGGKAYPRGTFAKHRGGLVRAVRNTDQLKDRTLDQSGWEVIGNWIHEIKVVLGEDMRTFGIGVETTDGKATVETFRVPVLIHRGVFKAGTEYVRGDAVTWDGSTWHCDHDTKAEPGNTTDWRLIVKRGAPGKDGASVKGEPGSPGRNGLDLTNMAPDGSKYR